MNLILENGETMSNELEAKIQEYMDYIKEHVNNVIFCFKKYFIPLINSFTGDLSLYSNEEFILAIKTKALSIDKHDLSKYNDCEFYPYRRHFHPTTEEKNCNDEDKQIADENFERAWTHHYENNMHHIQYWYDFKNSTPHDPDLPSIVEMICDWLAMGIKFKEPSIDYWWKNDAEKERSMMTPETISTIDEIFEILKK